MFTLLSGSTLFLNVMLQSSVDDPNRFNGYLVLAYGAIWLIGIAYVVSLANRQRNMEQDLQLMQRLLEDEEDNRED